MADNTTLNAGSGGDVIATDDIGGVKYQIVKNAFGAADTATQVSAANPFPVVQTGTPGLPTGAATAAKQPAIGTAGTSSADVITVQGRASMTPLLVDGSATTQPVSVASIPSHAVTNAGTFAVQAAQSGTFTVQPGNTANTTAWKVDGSAVTQPVSIASVPSHAVTNAGTFAVQAGQAASGASNAGNPVKIGGVYNSSAPTVTTGQMVDLQTDSHGNLNVNIASGAGSGGTSAADAATATRGTTTVTPVAGFVETSAPTLTTGKVGALSMDTSGNLRVTVSNGITGFAEDAAHTSGDVGLLLLARRNDTASSSSGTDGDYSTLNTNSTGMLRVDASGVAVPITDNSGSLTVDNAGTFAVQATLAAETTKVIGTVNVAASQTIATTNAGTFAVQAVPTAGTAGGASVNTLVAPATPAKNSIKTAAGTVYGFSAFNLLATPVYLKVWDVANGSITLGTTAATYQFMIPGNTAGAGFTVDIPVGIAHATAIQTAVTAGIALADNTSTSATSVIVNVYYK